MYDLVIGTLSTTIWIFIHLLLGIHIWAVNKYVPFTGVVNTPVLPSYALPMLNSTAWKIIGAFEPGGVNALVADVLKATGCLDAAKNVKRTFVINSFKETLSNLTAE